MSTDLKSFDHGSCPFGAVYAFQILSSRDGPFGIAAGAS